jgi:hypothetical protein
MPLSYVAELDFLFWNTKSSHQIGSLFETRPLPEQVRRSINWLTDNLSEALSRNADVMLAELRDGVRAHGSSADCQNYMG